MEPYFICCLILLTSFVEVHSETKVVRRGESVLLFANVTADSPDNEVHLYINGVKDNTLIASWKFENERFTMVSRIYHNIEMDGNRTIWIYNVDENYNGKYSLYNSWRPSIELIVLGNSQIKSENPSQNILFWIVCIALAIVASAFILYVAHKEKWGKKIRPCYKRRHGKHPTTKEIEEGNELESLIQSQDAEELQKRMDNHEKVSSEKPQYEKEIKEALVPLKARMDDHHEVIQELAEKVSSEKPQYEKEIKEALVPLKARIDYHDEMIQELAEKAKVEEQRVKEEEENMRKIIADLDANVETVKDLIAKVEMQRVKEEDMKYSHMLKTMTDISAKFGKLDTVKERYQNSFHEDGDMLLSSGNLGNVHRSLELQARTRVNEKDLEIERRMTNILRSKSSLISSHSNLINGAMEMMTPFSTLIVTKTPTSENRSDS